MTSSPHIDIEHVAQLARIALTESEKALYCKQLDQIIEFCKTVGAVDTSGIEPMSHPLPAENVWQEDVPGATLPVEEALKNAPARNGVYWVVPQVVDDGGE